MAPAPHERKDSGPAEDYPTSFPTMQSWTLSTIAGGSSVVINGPGRTTTISNPTAAPASQSSSSTSSEYKNGPAADSSTYPSSSYPTGSQSSQTPLPGQSGQLTAPQADRHHPPFPAIVTVGIIIPLILIGLSLMGCFYCIRQRRRQTRENVGAGPQMTNVANRGGMGPNERAYFGPVTTPPMAVLSPNTPTSPASSGPPPVILSTTMNNTYYTGIDTSDHISLTDQRSHTSAESIAGDEPPPPYRPASVPPISRETSLRATAPARNLNVAANRNDPMSGAGLIRRSEEVRSPFDDPESSDDDAISQISTIRSFPRRAEDQTSVVSDVSYQEEEQAQATHSHV
jgi:hypothetical protein